MSSINVESNVIKILRFPLIIGVLFIHSYIIDVIIDGINVASNDFFWFKNITFLFSQIICKVAVPAFFVISGYLLFHELDSFTKSTYLYKLRKRANSLLIPYVIWNVVVLIIIGASQIVLPNLISGDTKLISRYSLQDYFMSFWDTSLIGKRVTLFDLIIPVGDPIAYQFWFIRDLIFLVVLSNIIYPLVTRYGVVYILVCGTMWIYFSTTSAYGGRFLSLFFFSFGAYLSANKRSLTLDGSK